MISFEESFFQEEMREGFQVPSLMKRTWAAQMKILSQLQDFFHEHTLRYFAEMGTLLGAIRHHGFIPWDDDLDIAMPREDYMKLQELAQELPAPLRLKSFYVQEDFGEFHSVVSNCRETRLSWDEERMEQYFGCPFIVGVDIFPFDYLPKEPDRRRLQKLLYSMAHGLAYSYDEVFGEKRDTERTMKYEKDLHALEGYCQIVFDYDKPIRRQLFMLGDRIAMQCEAKDAEDFDYHIRFAGLPDDALMRKEEWYRELVPVEFESMQIMAPKEFEKVLETIYGEWKVPVNVMGSHDYPFYRNQVEFFELAGCGDKLRAL